MIKDKLINLERYKELFSEIIKQINSTNLDSLSTGRYDISDNLYFLVLDYKTTSNDINILENHKKYIDFQLIIRGAEKIAISDTFIKKHKEYSEESDYELVISNPEFIELKEEEFIVFYPGEYHRPGVINEQSQDIKKIVFKIKI